MQLNLSLSPQSKSFVTWLGLMIEIFSTAVISETKMRTKWTGCQVGNCWILELFEIKMLLQPSDLVSDIYIVASGA